MDSDKTDITAFGNYEVVRELARGGQGIVFEARHSQLDKRVAIKVLLDAGPKHQRRFRQEAQVLARLEHRNLVKVIDYGDAQGRPYLALEFVEGRDLKGVVKYEGIPSCEWSAQVLATIARAVHYCHEHGVVHRDIKPANILIAGSTGRPVLTDFGLLKRDKDVMELSMDERSNLTLAGATVGTPAYMAPEQVDPALPVGPLTDVYALGATLYFCLTGQAPIQGTTAYNMIVALLRDPPPDPREVNASVPARLAELCMRSMAKDPAERPESAKAFAIQLGRPGEAKRRRGSGGAHPQALVLGRVVALLLVLSTAVGSVWIWREGKQAEERAQAERAWAAAGQAAAEAEAERAKAERLEAERAEAERPEAERAEAERAEAERAEAGFTFLRTERFSVAFKADEGNEIRVYRNEKFAEALGLGPEETHVACEFALVPGGTFSMGSKSKPSEGPEHLVTIEPFLVARTEVTQRVWEGVMGTDPSLFKGESRPVDAVTWHDASKFCERTGLWLPSEAEWEYACRAGTTTRFAFGATITRAQVNCENDTTTDVGSLGHNAFGLFDMPGNVWEWCQDPGHDSYVGAPTRGWPAWSAKGNEYRVMRGGNALGPADYCRSAHRFWTEPTNGLSGHTGFRPAWR